MANGVYTRGIEIMQTGVDLESVTLTMLLVKPTYAFDRTELTIATAVTQELSGGGYSRATMTGVNVTRDGASTFTYLAGTLAGFGTITAGQTIAGAVLFRNTGVDATSVPITFYDVRDSGGNPIATDGTPVSLTPATAANGGWLSGQMAA